MSDKSRREGWQVRRQMWVGVVVAAGALGLAAALPPGPGGRLAAPAVALGLARPVAVAAAGDEAVVAYQAAGRTWVMARGAANGTAGGGRLVGAFRAPADGAVTLVPARLPGETAGAAGVAGMAGNPATAAGVTGLYAVAGGEARTLPLQAAAGPGVTAAIGPEAVRRALAADLDGDGADELLLLRGEAEAAPETRPGLGARVEVWQARDGALRLLWQGLEKYRPWQLAAGDIDGDGTAEWAAGVWTQAVYDPQWAERPWFYRWKESQPFALWLGSRLAHPFVDFALSPLAPGEPASLVALEAARDGGQTLSIYRWNSFGFTLEQIGPAWQRVLAFAALPPEAGCPVLAAVVEPSPGDTGQAPPPALVLLDSGPAGPGSGAPGSEAPRSEAPGSGAPGSPLREVARHPLASATAPTLAAVPGTLWLLDAGRLATFNTCPR